ncbi:MAG: hypothetical protein AABW41_02165 [Nanoarchaeota archaeon]
MKKLAIVFLLIVIFAIYVKADDILIESVSSVPDEVGPGENIDVSIKITNIGNKRIKDIIGRLDLSQVPFAPRRSASEDIVKDLSSDESSILIFSLVALPNATPGIYKVPLQISYNGTITKTTLLSLKVQVKPLISIEAEKSDILYRYTTGTITLKLVNKGLSDVKFLNVILENSPSYEIISSNQVYLGNIEIDDSDTVDFEVYVNKDSSIVLPIRLEYRDANNNLYRDTKSIAIKVYTKEEAQKLGLEKAGSSWSWIIIVLVIIVLILIFRQNRRKKEGR